MTGFSPIRAGSSSPVFGQDGAHLALFDALVTARVNIPTIASIYCVHPCTKQNETGRGDDGKNVLGAMACHRHVVAM
ncbi:hypothetical protein [Burkholderia gladioli]|uniref:hypothetical protein n=1 Tax=Burkholderia gladioli TaxID=28095 RepID=UPI001056E492|nr:hypothetical protein [Burkholderia gladioli]MDN7493999.1 hypothetical protein [Burkholderia gladioli]MDN7601565.1 hypothetical protein [Burkholderia gladioli]